MCHRFRKALGNDCRMQRLHYSCIMHNRSQHAYDTMACAMEKQNTSKVQIARKNFWKTIDNHIEWMYNYARSNDY